MARRTRRHVPRVLAARRGHPHGRDAGRPGVRRRRLAKRKAGAERGAARPLPSRCLRVEPGEGRSIEGDRRTSRHDGRDAGARLDRCDRAEQRGDRRQSRPRARPVERRRRRSRISTGTSWPRSIPSSDRPVVAGSRLALTRKQILAFRQHAGALDERLPRGRRSLRRAAWAGLQDSMPRAALLSIHARVQGTESSAWEDPSLVQLWGPRYQVYVVAATDRALFSLGRLPDDAKSRDKAEDLAARLHAHLGRQADEIRGGGASRSAWIRTASGTRPRPARS